MITIPVVSKTSVLCVCGHPHSAHAEISLSVALPEGHGTHYPQTWYDAIRQGIGKLFFGATYERDDCWLCGCGCFEQDHER